MNAGEQPVIGLTDTYSQPGVYTLEIPCPRTRSTATIHIEMTDEVTSDAHKSSRQRSWVSALLHVVTLLI